MIKEKFIALQIKNATGVNVFDKSRKQNIVDARSLFCFMLRKDFNFTLYEVREVFRANGKSFDHSSVHHNVLLFDEVRKRIPIMEKTRVTILTRLDPKYKLLEMVKGIDDEQEIERITNCIGNESSDQGIKII